MAAEKNYKIGRGRVYLSRAGASGFNYVGNSPEFNINVTTNTLDHFSSEAGINELDKSIDLNVTRAGTLKLDSMDLENMALFFFGSKTAVTTAAAAGLTDTFANVELDQSYKIGVTTAEPAGVFGVDPSTIAVTVGAVPKVVGTDFTIDGPNGIIKVLSTGTIVAGDTLTVTYDLLASTRQRVVSGSTPIRGRVMYVEDNPVGDNLTYMLPEVIIRPNGDLTLKGDAWQELSFNIAVLKPIGQEAIYIDGAPA